MILLWKLKFQIFDVAFLILLSEFTAFKGKKKFCFDMEEKKTPENGQTETSVWPLSGVLWQFS